MVSVIVKCRIQGLAYRRSQLDGTGEVPQVAGIFGPGWGDRPANIVKSSYPEGSGLEAVNPGAFNPILSMSSSA